MKNGLGGPARAVALSLGLVLVFQTGCYWDRLTSHYDDEVDLSRQQDDGAILEETGHDEETLARNRKRLEELAAEEEPVYRMNAGDRIEIRVYDHPDMCMNTKIGPDGMIGFAFMGQVKVSGLTIGEAANKIRDGLAPYMKSPVVSINVTDVESETATIAGACRKPGVYGISNSTLLADLYATAGTSAVRLFNGVDVDEADLEHSLVFRKGEILPVDFQLAIQQGEVLNNIRIRKGDYVYIAPRLEASVSICGEVAKPHKLLWEPGLGLIETLTTAGWMKDSHWQHVIIIRDGLAHPKMYKVDVDGILAGKCRNVKLKAGDIVYVPKDDISEYNVFVKKLLPTAQLFSLATSRFSSVSVLD